MDTFIDEQYRYKDNWLHHDSIAESSYRNFLQYNHAAFSNHLSNFSQYVYFFFTVLRGLTAPAEVMKS